MFKMVLYYAVFSWFQVVLVWITSTFLYNLQDTYVYCMIYIYCFDLLLFLWSGTCNSLLFAVAWFRVGLKARPAIITTVAPAFEPQQCPQVPNDFASVCTMSSYELHMSFMLNTMAWHRCLRPHVYMPGCCFWSDSKWLTLDLTWQAPFVTGSRRTGRTVSGAAIARAAIAPCWIKARVHAYKDSKSDRHSLFDDSNCFIRRIFKIIEMYSSIFKLLDAISYSFSISEGQPRARCFGSGGRFLVAQAQAMRFKGHNRTHRRKVIICQRP